MRIAWISIAGLLLLACGDGNGTSIGTSGTGPIAITAFCTELIEAGCDYGARCGGVPSDRAACRAELTDVWDACPQMQSAVALGEAGYDPAAARTLVEMTRNATCGGNPVPDPVREIPVFSPRIGAGATCHSDVSCQAGLDCQDVTVMNPVGTCAARM